MRNLKRALSLALASVMLVGMMVVGTSAASYPDVDGNDNTEAIDVLNAVGVMVGDENGNFNPDENVTRNQMAVVLAKLILGKNADKYVGTCPFTDVPEWAQKYVAACYDNKIVAGRSESIYDGDATVTAQEAAAMTLRVLGYEKLESTGTNWAQPVVAKANEIRLFVNVGSSATAPLNRNQVAQLSLNALQATMVTTKKGSTVNIGGVEITNDVEYVDRTEKYSTNSDRAMAISRPDTPVVGDDITLQLGEYLYDGDLKKQDGGSADDFGRPADSHWTMKGVSSDDMPTVAKSAVATFTGETSADDVASALSGYYVSYTTASNNVPVNNKDKRTAAIDGVKKNGTDVSDISISGKTVAKAIADETKNGLAIEFFADSNNVISDVIVTEYSVGEVTNVRETSKGTTYTVTPGGTGVVYNADQDEDDTVVLAGDVAKDDIVTTVRANGKLYIYPTTSFEGVQSSRNTNKNTITVDSKTYDVGVGLANVDMSGTNFPNSKDAATFYVDQYGYVVKSEAVEDASEYAVVDEIRYVDDGAIGSSKSVEARLVFTDGTSEIVKVTEVNGVEAKNITKKGTSGESTVKFNINDSTHKIVMSTLISDNDIMTGQVVEYTKSGSDYKIDFQLNSSKNGIESTSQASIGSGNAVTKGVPAFGSPSGNGTKDTIYLIKTDDAKYSVYTGYQNVTTVTYVSNAISMSWIEDDDGEVAVVYVDADGASATIGDNDPEIVYILDYKSYNEYKNDDKETRYEYTKAVLNGDDSKSVISQYKFTENGIYEVKLTDDGEIKSTPTPAFESLAGYTKSAVSADNTKDADTMYITTSGTSKGYNVKDANVYVIDDKTFSIGDGTSGEKGDVVFVKVKGTWNGTDKDAITVEKIYVIKDADKAQASSVTDVTEQFTQNGKEEVTLTTALGSNTVSVPAGKKLVLEETTTASGTVNLGKGATVELKKATGVLPTITGEGSVVVSGTATMTDSENGIKAVGGKAVTVANTGANTSVDKSTVKYSGNGTISTFSSTTLDNLINTVQNNGSTTVSPYYVKLPAAVCTSGNPIKGFRYANGTWTAMSGAFVADGNGQDQEFFLMEGDKVEKICFVIGLGDKASTVTNTGVTGVTGLPTTDLYNGNDVTSDCYRIIEISFTTAG